MNNYFHIFALGNCPYCLEAISILNHTNNEYVLTMLDRCAPYLDYVKDKYQYLTVPIILECDRETNEMINFIGGCSDLKERFDIVSENEQCQLP